MWVRRNEHKLRVELYSGLRNAVLRGDTTAASIGKRIVLPSNSQEAQDIWLRIIKM